MDEGVPQHRVQPCKDWCDLMLSEDCPAKDVQVQNEAECFEGCIHSDAKWRPEDGEDGEDACADTVIAYTDCLKALTCSEIVEHFELRNEVPPVERSTCGETLQAQLTCQDDH